MLIKFLLNFGKFKTTDSLHFILIIKKNCLPKNMTTFKTPQHPGLHEATKFKGLSPAEGNQIISCSTDAFYHLLYFFLLLILTFESAGDAYALFTVSLKFDRTLRPQVAISSIKKQATGWKMCATLVFDSRGRLHMH